jgi:Delta7-sterol 5-desaturase
MWPPLYGGGFWVAFAQAATVYYTAATTLHYIVPAVTQVRSVQKGHPAQGQVTREAFASLCPLAVKAAVWTITERLHAAGYGLLYDGPVKSLQAIAYLVFTIIALDYLHDAWFYWTHRLLHWAPVYRHVHYIHHKSTVPTAFAGYSFHSAEAALVFANEILVCFLFPVHMGLHRLYHIFTTLIHNGECDTAWHLHFYHM